MRILYAYFDYMHSIGWLSTKGTIKDYIVAVVPPTVVVTVVAHFIVSAIVRIFE